LQPENATMSRTATVVSALIAAAVFIWLAFDLLLLVFAGVLLAIFLRTLAIWISGLTRLKVGWSLTIVLLLLLGGAALTSVLFAPRLAEETQQLTEKLPEAVTQLTDWLRGYSWGRWLLNEMPDGPAGEGSGQVVERATGAASKLFHGIVAFAIVLFVGIYLAAEPEPYQRGLLRLFPIARRQRAGEVMFATGYTLRWWLFGQILAMLIVGLTMGIGLSIIGVPLAFALGVLAGLLEFIPTLGPPIAVVPAILLALVDDPQKALYVLILYSIAYRLHHRHQAHAFAHRDVLPEDRSTMSGVTSAISRQAGPRASVEDGRERLRRDARRVLDREVQLQRAVGLLHRPDVGFGLAVRHQVLLPKGRVATSGGTSRNCRRS
jgi:predicted PurR-regulated permease PerM